MTVGERAVEIGGGILWPELQLFLLALKHLQIMFTQED